MIEVNMGNEPLHLRRNILQGSQSWAGSSDGSPDHGKCLEAECALDKDKSSVCGGNPGAKRIQLFWCRWQHVLRKWPVSWNLCSAPIICLRMLPRGEIDRQ